MSFLFFVVCMCKARVFKSLLIPMHRCAIRFIFFLFFTFFFFVVMTMCFVAAWVIGAFFFFYRCCWAVPSVRSIDRRERKGYTLNDPRFRQSYKRKHIEACMFFFFFFQDSSLIQVSSAAVHSYVNGCIWTLHTTRGLKYIKEHI